MNHPAPPSGGYGWQSKRIKNYELRSTSIKYYSTNLKSPEISFKDALLQGLAPDGGLYLPKSIPMFTGREMESFSNKEYPEIAFLILNKLIGDEINKDDLLNVCNDAYDFKIPLEKVHDRNYIIRLDQGPTASFKDFAARVMSRLMQYYLSIDNKHLTILTATSGDTGSAVASAFYGMKNINVIILFPSDEVTLMQRKQMTTLQNNINVIAIDGKFDDCQNLVKEAFMDHSLSHLALSSANSINIGRLLPQSIYYFYAWSKLSSNFNEKVVFSVPSGNFGNLMGGLIAREMGLPVGKFIISTNSNDEVPEFLRTGNYNKIIPSKNCISSAMNVGHPSNLARVIALYGGMMNETGEIVTTPNLSRMRDDFFTVSVTDDETRSTIEEMYRNFRLLLEPHGSIAWYGIKKYLKFSGNISSRNQLCISLETAHPAKFPDEIQQILHINPPLPHSLVGISDKFEYYVSLNNNFMELKEFILKSSETKKI